MQIHLNIFVQVNFSSFSELFIGYLSDNMHLTRINVIKNLECAQLLNVCLWKSFYVRIKFRNDKNDLNIQLQSLTDYKKQSCLKIFEFKNFIRSSQQRKILEVNTLLN